MSSRSRPRAATSVAMSSSTCPPRTAQRALALASGSCRRAWRPRSRPRSSAASQPGRRRASCARTPAPARAPPRAGARSACRPCRGRVPGRTGGRSRPRRLVADAASNRAGPSCNGGELADLAVERGREEHRLALLGSRRTIRSTCGWKPMSSIRSASSRTSDPDAVERDEPALDQVLQAARRRHEDVGVAGALACAGIAMPP